MRTRIAGSMFLTSVSCEAQVMAGEEPQDIACPLTPCLPGPSMHSFSLGSDSACYGPTLSQSTLRIYL